MVSFPPHCSHRLQPLDVSVFKPFKTAVNNLRADWVKMNPGRTMSIYDIPSIVDRAIEIGITPVNIKSGIRATGIWPLDSEIFQDIDFLPSATTDRPYTPDDILDKSAIPTAANKKVEMDSIKMDIDSLDRPLSTSTQCASTLSLNEALQSIRPFPKAPPRKKNTRGRKPSRSRILTDDDVMQEITEEQCKREERAEKKRKPQLRGRPPKQKGPQPGPSDIAPPKRSRRTNNVHESYYKSENSE